MQLTVAGDHGEVGHSVQSRVVEARAPENVTATIPPLKTEGNRATVSHKKTTLVMTLHVQVKSEDEYVISKYCYIIALCLTGETNVYF